MKATVMNEAAAAAAAAEPAGELDSLLRAPSSRKSPEAAAVCVGHVASLGAAGAVNVEFPGSGGAVVARMALPVTPGQLLAAVRTSQPVVLLFENGDRALPIVTGFIQPPQNETAIESTTESQRNTPQVIEADVDGKRVRIVAQDEIVLQCGNASVTLRRNGRVIIRGTYVETHSEGTNRIKGGQVRIN
jgi:hypothetical protein